MVIGIFFVVGARVAPNEMVRSCRQSWSLLARDAGLIMFIYSLYLISISSFFDVLIGIIVLLLDDRRRQKYGM